jgi:hypothetical protein
LNGTTVSLDRAIPKTKFSVTGLAGDGYEGVAMSTPIAGRSSLFAPVANGSVTDTSSIIEYQDGNLYFLKPGNGPAALTIPIFSSDSSANTTSTPNLNLVLPGFPWVM